MDKNTETWEPWLEDEDLKRILKGTNELQRAKAGHRGAYALNVAIYALEAVPEEDPLASILESIHELLCTLVEAWPVREGVYIR